MIIKAIPKHPELALVRSTHYDSGPNAVQSGTHYFYEEPEKRSYLEFQNHLAGTEEVALHLVDADIEPTPRVEGSSGEPIWVMRFASWWHEGHCHVVLTSGKLFLMSESGETIDRLF